MARTVTLTNLRARVRRRTDTESETARFPDAELDDDINEGIARFHVERVRIRPQGVDEATTSFTTTAGTSVYALPAEFLSVTKVWTTINDVEFQLRPFGESDTDGLVEPTSWALLSAIGFRLLGDNVELRPTPDAAYTIRIKYVSTAVRLSDPSDTLDGVDGFEEFVVAWAAKRVFFKNRDKAGMAECDAIMGDVADGMRVLDATRNAAGPPQMADVRPSPRSRYMRWGRRLP